MVIAIILIILPFVIIFPIGYYYNDLPYTDDGYCDLFGHAPAECIFTRSDNGVTYPVHEFCPLDEYIYLFSVKLLIDLGFLHTNLIVPNDILTQTRYYQVFVFIIYYFGIAFPILLSIHGRSKASQGLPPQPLPLPPPP